MSIKHILAAVAAVAFCICAAVVSGCTEPLTMYQVPDSGSYYASGRRILVMPFMDTRTFTDNSDPHKMDLGHYARSIFVEAMREHDAGYGVAVVTPHMAQPVRSMTNAEVAEIGRQHDADVVVAGQVFSFTNTRAASIPPRAGMFVRVISSQDGALLFTGDHYQAASRPMAGGGRDLQARNVSNRLVEGFLSGIHSDSVANVLHGVASDNAYAMMPPPPARARPRWKSLFTNHGGRQQSRVNDTRTEPIPGPALDNLLNPDEWDEQIVPEVPPLLDFDEDFYRLPAPALSETPLPPPPPPLDDAELSPVSDTAAATAENDAQPETNATVTATMMDEPLPLPPPSPEELAEFVEPTPPPVAEVQTATVVAVPDTGSLDFAAFNNAIVAAPALVADTASAEVIDELPEIDLRLVDPNMIPVDAVYPPPAVAAKISGDELAADLLEAEEDWRESASTRPMALTIRSEEYSARPDEFSSPGEIPELRQTPARSARVERHGIARNPEPPSTPVVVARTGRTGGEAPTTVTVPMALTLEEPVPATQAQGEDGPRALRFDPDTLELLPPARETPVPLSRGDDSPAADRVPASNAATSFYGPKLMAPLVSPDVAMDDDGGPVVSMPLGVEQPRTVKSVDRELAVDPEAALQDAEALVSRPSRGRSGGVRVLILPYHDRDNPNNLIPNTGGGEVVTTLYGTQMALDPGVQIMWDGSGQATHTRLISREEAVEMGQLAGADYVMRGQVVEFRRAQSVPSFYSAVISTAMLAAQIFFAEMSGVDVATEVYRVRDGLCVMSRRDRAQQKYVVQAEKTVRRMATGMAESVSLAIRERNPEAMDPLIDDLSPWTVMSNPQ